MVPSVSPGTGCARSSSFTYRNHLPHCPRQPVLLVGDNANQSVNAFTRRAVQVLKSIAFQPNEWRHHSCGPTTAVWSWIHPKGHPDPTRCGHTTFRFGGRQEAHGGICKEPCTIGSISNKFTTHSRLCKKNSGRVAIFSTQPRRSWYLRCSCWAVRFTPSGDLPKTAHVKACLRPQRPRTWPLLS
jgi:hypothetical protein